MSPTPPSDNRPSNRFDTPPNAANDNSPPTLPSAGANLSGGQQAVPPSGSYGSPYMPPVQTSPTQVRARGRSASGTSSVTWLTAVALVCLLGFAAVIAIKKPWDHHDNGGSSIAKLPPPPKPLTPTEIAERARPATVLIFTKFQATIEMPEVTFDIDKLKERIEEKQIPAEASDSEKSAIMLNLLFANPDAYLTSGTSTRSAQAETLATGSGFILNPDGYVATNAHVVEPDPDVLKGELVKTLKKWFDEDVDKIKEIVPRLLPGSSLNADAEERLKGALLKFYQANMHLGSIDKTVRAAINSAKSMAGGKPDIVTCDVKRVGKPTPGKDVAILKMPGINLPTLPLAQNITVNNMRTGEALHVVGYPGTATFNPNFSPESIMEPSMTNGFVSRKTTMVDGWQVIQTDAPSTHGNSGGPVLNEYGEVIGILTFGSIDQNSGEAVQGFSFIMPADIIREFTTDANVPLPAPPAPAPPAPVAPR